MATFSILSLGTRRDAKQFRKGALEKLKLTEGLTVSGTKPSLNAIKTLFARSDDVLFLAGHYDGLLYNEDKTILLTFGHDGLTIDYDGQSQELIRGAEFKQTKPKLVIWGGCSVCDSSSTIITMQTLFGSHVMLGWIGQTGWEITDIMFGGKGNGHAGSEPLPTFGAPNYFDRIATSMEATKFWQSWLQVANEIAWGNAPDGSPYIKRFCAVDAGGKKHLASETVTGV